MNQHVQGPRVTMGLRTMQRLKGTGCGLFSLMTPHGVTVVGVGHFCLLHGWDAEKVELVGPQVLW